MTFQPTPMCMAKYNRSDRLHGNYQSLFCSNPRVSGGECEGPHSWQSMYDNDSQMLDAVINRLHERDIEISDAPLGVPAEPVEPRSKWERRYPVNVMVEDVCEALHNGELDSYIEMILAAGHGRKKALRGLRGFDR